MEGVRSRDIDAAQRVLKGPSVASHGKAVLMTSTPHFPARLLVAAVMLFGAAAFAQTTPASERCAIRLSTTLLGKSPASTLMSNATPQNQVDAMLTSADFIEKFSRFTNAKLNLLPGEEPAEDATYYLTRYILQNGKPWKDLFIGPYRVDRGATRTDPAVVVSDTNGLGYFRSPVWMRRYAGNEIDGYRIVAAYRIMQNTVGLKLVAAVNTDGINATGRMAPPCNSCHYNSVFALDLAAKVLSKRKGTGETMTFTAPNEGPQTLLGGQTVANDKEFVTALVNSKDFQFRACRLATEFLYGRTEFKCEGPVFDKCMSEFQSKGTIQAAIAAIAKDASYCQ